MTHAPAPHGLRIEGAWRVCAVLGGWEGKTLYRERAWVAPDGERAVFVSAWGGGVWDDGALGWCVMDLRDGATLASGVTAVSQEPLVELEFEPDGRGVRALDAEERVFRVDLGRGVASSSFALGPWGAQRRRVESAVAPEPGVTPIGLDATGRWLLATPTGAALGEALVRYDLAAGTRRALGRGHTASVIALSHSDDGARIVSAQREGVIRVWSTDDAACQWTFEPPASTERVRLERDGRSVTAWCVSPPPPRETGWMTRWRLDDGEALLGATLDAAGAESPGDALSVDGDLLASIAPSGRELILRRVDRRGGEVLRGRVPFAMRVAAVRFCGATTLRLVGVDGRRWCCAEVDVADSLERGRCVPVGEMEPTEIDQEFGEPYVSDDGAWALLPVDGGAYRWCELGVRRGGAVLRRRARGEVVVGASLGGGGAALAHDGVVEVWDTLGARQLRVDLGARHDLVSAVSLSDSGDRVAIGTALGVVVALAKEGER